MATIKVMNMAGQPVGSEAELNDAVFAVPVRNDLAHMAVVVEEANKRQGTHETKTRGEVSGGGKKPWRQKGTGRARQGSTRAPHWYHGGVTFGPHNRDYSKEMPRKMRHAALRSVLSAKLEAGVFVAVDSIKFETPKTKAAAEMLKALNVSTKRVLVLLPEYDLSAYKSFRNIPGVEVRHAPNVSVRDLVLAGTIVTTVSALETMQGVCAK